MSELHSKLTSIRHAIHREPELGFQETQTKARVAEYLRELGLDVHEGVGVVGILTSGNGNRAIGLRAELDALPIHETSTHNYVSNNPGVMHACGHDGHTVMLLGAAEHLAETRAFDGTVYFCFQPAEENGGGADAMIKDGLFERFPCRAMYGMHNLPGLPVGHFATTPGPMLAACDEFSITITGLGGHAAEPHDCRDTIVCGSAVVQSLQTIASRRIAPRNPCVVSVTQFHAGDANNVIPQVVKLSGTVRSFDEEVHKAIYAEMERIVSQVCAAHDCTGEVDGGHVYYPPTINDPTETKFCVEVAREVAGEGAVRDDHTISMGAEDFSFYALKKPACFVMIGNGDSALLHHAKYDFDDSATPWGSSFFARLVEKALPTG